MGVRLELKDKQFGRLTVLSRYGKDNYGNLTWNCICTCGVKTVVIGRSLKGGNTKSCGCLQIESATTHGLTNSRTYRTWDAMKGRCYRPRNNRYYMYGAKGIRVCDR